MRFRPTMFGPVIVVKDGNLVNEVARRAAEEGFFAVELIRYDLPSRGVTVALGLARLSVREDDEKRLEEKARRLAEELARIYENRLYIAKREAEHFVLENGSFKKEEVSPSESSKSPSTTVTPTL